MAATTTSRPAHSNRTAQGSEPELTCACGHTECSGDCRADRQDDQLVHHDEDYYPRD